MRRAIAACVKAREIEKESIDYVHEFDVTSNLRNALA
jgi:hypothetical protein